ncbi:MAG: hypothetical protein H6Q97_1002 [Nitrospirae bacterium]|nr:hypothetical protein [Nitrospirota bacterium]
MGFIISKVLLLLLLPPASLLILILAGLILLRRHPSAGRKLVAAGIALLYMLSLEPVSDRLIRPLEAAYLPLNVADIKADAVVVLGSGVNDLSWLPARPEPSPSSLQRLIEGIRIARNLRIPLVVSGGSGALAPTEAREADAMAALAVKLGYPRGDLVIENRSRNTWENAEQVKGLVSGRTIILVTSAFHLKRDSELPKKDNGIFFYLIPNRGTHTHYLFLTIRPKRGIISLTLNYLIWHYHGNTI